MSLEIQGLSAVPSQDLTVNLGGQACQIKVYQVSTGLFIDLSVNDTLIIGGVICQNLNSIVRDAYRGFIGDLQFLDTVGNDDPVYTGLGSRFLLFYLTADEVAGVL